MAKKQWKYVDFCQRCRVPLGPDDKVMYVEEGTNRFFCSEKCIREYYDPASEFYRKELAELRDPHDIPDAEFQKYESYAPLCLSNPDEVWFEETEHGDGFYFFIGNYTNEGGRFSYVVMCFCLELEPTYIIMAFPTRDKKLVEVFRRGEQVDMAAEEEASEPVTTAAKETLLENQGKALEEEMLRWRSKDDISPDEFEEYSHYLEQTIEGPDEVWELQDEKESAILTLIGSPEDGLTYIVICTLDGGMEGQESWRVLYNFPTRDPALVQRYRRGVLREGNDSGAGGGTTKFLQ